MTRCNGIVKGARAKKSAIRRHLMCVEDMVRAGHRVIFDQDADGNDFSHAMRRDTLEKIPFLECGNTWDIELELVPKADVAIA